jgi:hypothetical protein
MEEQMLESSPSTCSRGGSEAYHVQATDHGLLRQSGLHCMKNGYGSAHSSSYTHSSVKSTYPVTANQPLTRESALTFLIACRELSATTGELLFHPCNQ